MRASHHGFVVVLPGVGGGVLCGGSVCEHLPLLALNRAAGRMVCSVSPRQVGGGYQCYRTQTRIFAERLGSCDVTRCLRDALAQTLECSRR